MSRAQADALQHHPDTSTPSTLPMIDERPAFEDCEKKTSETQDPNSDDIPETKAEKPIAMEERKTKLMQKTHD